MRSHKHIFVSIFLFCVGIGSLSLKPASLPLNALQIPNVRYVLPNGLRVILAQDHRIPFVAVNLWYYVGAVNEKPNKTGFAHLFEHLMFEGSAHVPNGAHFGSLEKAGAFSVNATTSFDRTNYFQTVPAHQLELALALEKDRMRGLIIDQEKLDDQRKVVKNERRQRYDNSPYALAGQALWQHIFPKNHPFHGQVIGSMEDLDHATVQDAQNFYNAFYNPQNACLVLVGDFKIDEAKALIWKYFGPEKNGPTPPKIEMPKTVLSKEEKIEVTEKLGKLPLVRIHYITPPIYTSDDAALDVYAHILAGGPYSRLTKALTYTNRFAQSVSAYQQSYKELSVFTIDVLAQPGITTDSILRVTDQVLGDLERNPITPIELDRARNGLLTSYFFSLQELGGLSGRADRLQTYEYFAHDPNYLSKDVERYTQLTPQDVTRVAKKYIPVGKNRAILFAIPEASQSTPLKKETK